MNNYNQTFKNPKGNEHKCIRDCGRQGMFLKKYRMDGESPFFPAWFCIECIDAFKSVHYNKKLGRVDYWGKSF